MTGLSSSNPPRAALAALLRALREHGDRRMGVVFVLLLVKRTIISKPAGARFTLSEEAYGLGRLPPHLTVHDFADAW